MSLKKSHEAKLSLLKNKLLLLMPTEEIEKDFTSMSLDEAIIKASEYITFLKKNNIKTMSTSHHHATQQEISSIEITKINDIYQK